MSTPEPPGSIELGNVSNSIGVAVGTGARSYVKIINNYLAQGGPITQYGYLAKDFIAFYVGTPEHPKPFGGRQAKLDELNAWLRDADAPRYAAMIAPAGFGKSALLAHWVVQLYDKVDIDRLHIVYFPISARFNSNLDSVAFASLAAQLARIHGQKVEQAFDARQYRGLFSDYIRRPPADGYRVLVVIDGLDEAAGWQAGADLFPQNQPEHLRVLVSARPFPDDEDHSAWMYRLGWNALATKQFELATLDREGMREVLTRLGGPIAEIPNRPEIFSKLYDATQGDPFLIGLYGEALFKRENGSALMQPEDLLRVQPDLDGYYQEWRDREQKNVWAKEKEPGYERRVRAFLRLLALAKGALQSVDVIELIGDNDLIPDSDMLRDVAGATALFVVGDGTERGYVFRHPRLNEYFSSDKSMTPVERRAWRKRFTDYGARGLAQLQSGEIEAKEVSRYLVHYYGAHLEEAKVPAEEVYAQVCEPWLRAWEWVEGTPDGFLSDVRRAWSRAKTEESDGIGMQVRAALCFSSVASVSANINNGLLEACVKEGIVSPALGLVLALRKPDFDDQTGAVIAVAPFQGTRANRLVRDRLLTAFKSDSEFARHPVSMLVESLPENIMPELLQILTSKADEMETAIWSLTRHLAQPERDAILARAIVMARELRRASDRVEALRALVPYLPEQQQESLLEEALETARKIPDEEGARAAAWSALAKQLPESGREKVLQEALASTQHVSNERTRADILIELANHLPEHLLKKVVASVEAISDEAERARALAALAKYLPAQLSKEAMASAQAISDEEKRAQVLSALTRQLPGSEREAVLGEALARAREISDDRDRAQVLSILSEGLPQQQRETVLEEALASAQKIKYAWQLPEVLRHLVDHLPARLLPKALTSVQAIEDEGDRATVLTAMAEHLPQGLMGEALARARALQDRNVRAVVLSALAKQLPESERGKVLEEALESARAIADNNDRADALSELAKQLPKSERKSALEEALASARTIRDDGERARVLCTLGERLPGPERGAVIGEALTSTRGIRDATERAQVLAGLAKYLSEDLMREALKSARAIKNELYRVPVLSALAPYLPEQLLGEAFLHAQVSKFEWERAEALSAIVKHLPEPLLGKALENLAVIEGESERAKVLIVLAKRFPQDLLPRAWAIAGKISSSWERGPVLSALAERLPESFLPEVLASARKFWYVPAHSEVLCVLAKRIPEDLVEQVLLSTTEIWDIGDRAQVLTALAERYPERLLPQALADAQRIGDEAKRARVLSALAEHLPEPQRGTVLTEALESARAIGDQGARALVLGALAKQLPESEQGAVLEEAFASAQAIRFRQDRIQVTETLAADLPESLWEGVLAKAQEIEDVSDKAITLAALAGHLPEHLLGKALASVGALDYEGDRVQVLSGLARNLREPLLGEALEIALAITSANHRAEALSALAEYLPDSYLGKVENAIHTLHVGPGIIPVLKAMALRWPVFSQKAGRNEIGELSAMLETFAKGKRDQLLRAIGALAPVIDRLGGERAVKETADAIVETARWWP